MSQLATSLQVDVLGSQPFVGLAGGFTRAADELLTLSNELTTTSNALAANGGDARAIGRDLLLLQDAVDSVRDGLKGAPNTSVTAADLGSLRIVVGALIAWLAVQAIAAVFIGMWLFARVRRRAVIVGE
jgi:hypothetical protein